MADPQENNPIFKETAKHWANVYAGSSYKVGQGYNILLCKMLWGCGKFEIKIGLFLPNLFPQIISGSLGCRIIRLLAAAFRILAVAFLCQAASSIFTFSMYDSKCKGNSSLCVLSFI